MKLYKVRLGMNSDELSRRTNIDITIEGDNPSDDEGDWSASDELSKRLCEIYFGDTDGYWHSRSTQTNSATFFLYDAAPPKIYNFLWHDSLLVMDLTLVTEGNRRAFPMSIGDSLLGLNFKYNPVLKYYGVVVERGF